MRIEDIVFTVSLKTLNEAVARAQIVGYSVMLPSCNTVSKPLYKDENNLDQERIAASATKKSNDVPIVSSIRCDSFSLSFHDCL